MRCKACDVILEEYELVKKDEEGFFLDLCSWCGKISETTLRDEFKDYEVDSYDSNDEGEDDGFES